jgi:hypothetical protein
MHALVVVIAWSVISKNQLFKSGCTSLAVSNTDHVTKE